MRDVPETGPRSVTALLQDMFEHLQALVRNEVDLAKAEAREALTKAATGIGLLVASIVVAVCALNVLTGALVAALAAGLDLSVGWASLIVGIGYLVVVAILVAIARANFKNITPRRTARNVEADARTIKESLHD
ncbi:phage holin family protein [Wenxinia saemankumensis]|uniref:Putative Holin-X, holin superfamily III n=1 Tax=Wenxinia saemankumensis TaxID=1447782 RepID=A0A1M6BVC6_9RHOB|nr:phage holin family protein [Wenxinia saemankumensis]SHI52474.1 Putative Holin-X, holin superfamily III [Wenxinia saemankumensis]